MANANTNGTTPSAPKRRGRKPRSVSPVTLTIDIDGSPTMIGRVENIIDDLPQVAEIVDKTETDAGFGFILRFKTGPDGRMARKGIAGSLAKLKSKGRILRARIATNVINV
jgi:hypothetical protein